MTKYNLNSDMAEGYGPWTMGDDDGLLQIVQSANIACGYHGGDHNIMARVMASAHQNGVSIAQMYRLDLYEQSLNKRTPMLSIRLFKPQIHGKNSRPDVLFNGNGEFKSLELKAWLSGWGPSFIH